MRSRKLVGVCSLNDASRLSYDKYVKGIQQSTINLPISIPLFI